MAELVDAHGSGPCAARCGGSSPLLGTSFKFLSETLEKISSILKVEMHEFFQFRGTDTVREMRTFLIQTASEIGEEKLDAVVRVIRQVLNKYRVFALFVSSNRSPQSNFKDQTGLSWATLTGRGNQKR